MLLVRAGRWENQQSHIRHAEATGTVMRGCGGHAEWGCQQHEQYPAGGLAGPLALLVEPTQFSLPLHAPAWNHHPHPHLSGPELASQTVSTLLLWG